VQQSTPRLSRIAGEDFSTEYFPAMFAQHSYDIVPNPARLTATMCSLFARLLRGA